MSISQNHHSLDALPGLHHPEHPVYQQPRQGVGGGGWVGPSPAESEAAGETSARWQEGLPWPELWAEMDPSFEIGPECRVLMMERRGRKERTGGTEDAGGLGISHRSPPAKADNTH